MDTNKLDQICEEKEENEVSNEKDEHSLYNYLKEHPGVMVSIVSALMVVITFVINLAIYIRTSRYLEYWGVNTLNIDFNNTNLMYVFAGAGIYYMLNMFTQPFFMNSYEKYIKDMRVNYYEKYYCKFLRKEIKQCQKRLSELKKENKRQKNEKTDSEEIIKIKKSLEQVRKYIQESEILCKKISKVIRRKLVISVILTFLFYSLEIYVLMLITSKSTNGWRILLATVLGALIILLILFGILFFTIRRKEVKKIKKEVFDGGVDFKKLYIQENSIDYEYPIDKLFNFDFNGFFSNKSISFLVGQIILCMLYILLIVNPLDETNMKNKQEFSIVNEEGVNYVLIYNNEQFYYLVEATIENEKIVIDTTKQRVSVQDDIIYENMKFEEVVRNTLEE